MAITTNVDVSRTVNIGSDSGGITMQNLVDALTALIAKPAIGPDAVVERIGGGGPLITLAIRNPGQ